MKKIVLSIIFIINITFLTYGATDYPSWWYYTDKNDANSYMKYGSSSFDSSKINSNGGWCCYTSSTEYLAAKNNSFYQIYKIPSGSSDKWYIFDASGWCVFDENGYDNSNDALSAMGYSLNTYTGGSSGTTSNSSGTTNSNNNSSGSTNNSSSNAPSNAISPTAPLSRLDISSPGDDDLASRVTNDQLQGDFSLFGIYIADPINQISGNSAFLGDGNSTQLQSFYNLLDTNNFFTETLKKVVESLAELYGKASLYFSEKDYVLSDADALDAAAQRTHVKKQSFLQQALDVGMKIVGIFILLYTFLLLIVYLIAYYTGGTSQIYEYMTFKQDNFIETTLMKVLIKCVILVFVAVFFISTPFRELCFNGISYMVSGLVNIIHKF